MVGDRPPDEFLPLSVLPSDVRASLRSNNAEGKNGLPHRRHHPCQPLPLSHRSRVSYFSRRRSWRGRPFCSLAQGHRPYSYSTHDSCRDRCHRRSKRRICVPRRYALLLNANLSAEARYGNACSRAGASLLRAPGHAERQVVARSTRAGLRRCGV